MTSEKKDSHRITGPPVFVVSSSMGTLGEQVARAVLPQFRGAHLTVQVFRRVQQISQVEEILTEAAETNATIIHTIANSDLRQIFIEKAAERGVVTIDVVGPLIEHLTGLLGIEPVGKPGLYRELNENYFRRIQAIEFTMTHDDGMNYQDWPDAEIILTGVSRVGKTPLSLYLSMLGWRVANIPIVPGIPPREEMFDLDYRRVVGLTIDPLQLHHHRQHRVRNLRLGHSDYGDLEKLHEEIKATKRVFRQGGFRVIDVTNKPIETTAGQVIDLVTRRMKEQA